MSVGELFAVGTSSSSNIDTRVCFYFGLFRLSIWVCGMFVSDHCALLGKVIRSIKLAGLLCFCPPM